MADATGPRAQDPTQELGGRVWLREFESGPGGPAAAGEAEDPRLARALEDLERDGCAVVPDVLSPEETRALHERLRSLAASEAAAGEGYYHDGGNQRVWALLNKGPEFVALAQHPFAIALCRALLGERFLLGNISANITAPGAQPMFLHADQVYVPEPWPAFPLIVNVSWAVTDFREANGATRAVPGSHRWNRNPAEGEAVETVPLEAPAGSAVVVDGRCWHTHGHNRTADEHRYGIFPYYCRPHLRTQENWSLSLEPEVRRGAGPLLRELCGFEPWQYIGVVNGPSPHEPTY